ncbi:hypothetical protein [Paraburkholderia monticola]|nr:hypothetical protein [Paraburkholderia monticola]
MLFPRRIDRADGFAALVQHAIGNAYLNVPTLDIDCGTRQALNNMKRARR